VATPNIRGIDLANSLLVLEKELQVHLKDRLEQPHVGALVQTDLVLPDVDDEDLAGSEGEECALPLKVLVLASLAAVGTLDVHDEDIVGHLGPGALGALVLGHPDALGSLASLGLGHDGEGGAEEVVEQGGLAGGLGAKDGDEVVVEASVGDVGDLEVVVELVTAGGFDSVSRVVTAGARMRLAGYTYLNSLSSSMTWTPCSYLTAPAVSPTAEKWPFIVATV
jgi:hypothetical protein